MVLVLKLCAGVSSNALVQGYNRCANEVSAFSRSSPSRSLLSWICMTLKLVHDSFFFSRVSDSDLI